MAFLGLRTNLDWQQPATLRIAIRFMLLLAGVGLTSWIWPWTFFASPPGCGPFGSTTTAALCGALLVPLAAHAYLSAGERRERWIAGAALASLALWVLLTGVRASWLAAALGFAYVLFNHRSTPHKRWLASIAAGLALLALLTPLKLFHSGGPQSSLRSLRDELVSLANLSRDSGGERLILWRNGLELVASAPVLGLGLGRLRDEYPTSLEFGALHSHTSLDTHRTPRHLHCDPLEVWVELGPLGLALLVAGALAAWSSRDRSSAHRGVWIVFGISSLFQPTLYDPVALALLVPTLGGAYRCAGIAWNSRGIWWTPICAAAVLVLSLAAYSSWQQVRSDWQHDRAMSALDALPSDPAAKDEGLAAALAATALAPEDTDKTLGLATWWRRHGAPARALESLAAADRSGPGSLWRLGLRAEVLHDLGRDREAQRALEQLLNYQPQSHAAARALAAWARGLGSAAEAAPLERLARTVPWIEDPTFWHQLGVLRLRQHEEFGAPRHLRLAEDALQRALQHRPKSAELEAETRISLTEARLKMAGRDQSEGELVGVIKSLWPRIKLEERQTAVLARLRTLIRLAKNEGFANLALELESLVLELEPR